MRPETLIRRLALECGFDLCGIASLASPPESLQGLDAWLEQGHHAGMEWMRRQKERRLDPTKVLSNAHSFICLGLVYNTSKPLSTDVFPLAGRRPTTPAGSESRGWISRYAWGTDYHRIFETRLAELSRAIRLNLDASATFLPFCDAGPIAEKAWAARSGLGWQGKHTNLIHREKGSWFFLGELLTDLELEPDEPEPDRCGACTRCLDACPTKALVRPYVLDARLCLSYRTIEHRGDFPEAWSGESTPNVFGCDICQDVCPWNRRRLPGSVAEFEPREGLFAPDLQALSRITEDELSGPLHDSPLKRAKAAGLRRNAAAALNRPRA
jgi:epoxyqueuosine reductase